MDISAHKMSRHKSVEAKSKVFEGVTLRLIADMQNTYTRQEAEVQL